MKMTLHRLTLPLAHEFTISRGSITQQSSVVVELSHDGLSGFGEVSENRYYGHTCESIETSLGQVVNLIDQYLDSAPETLWQKMKDTLNGDMFALSALDMAAHDLFGKRQGLPTWQVWGLDWNDVPDSSFTIGIDSIDKMVAKMDEQSGWQIYKIKLGTSNDLEIMSELRRHSDAVFRVDANCGWTPDQAVEYSRKLADLNVEFIEQPLPADAPDADKLFVYQNSALPVLADENCQTQPDVAACAPFFHGVNVKLCKCGGLSSALQMLKEAETLGLKKMVGCMIESSIAISGAAQLLPLLDYADLDGPSLLSHDPATGIPVECGAVQRPQNAGTGAGLKPAK